MSSASAGTNFMDTEGVCQCKSAADTDGRSGEIENANAEA